MGESTAGSPLASDPLAGVRHSAVLPPATLPPTAETGAQLRDRGVAAANRGALSAEDKAWEKRVDECIAVLAASGKDFTADDVRDMVKQDPPNGSMARWGGRMLAAVNAKRVFATTRSVNSGRKAAHARRLVIYRGTDEESGAAHARAQAALIDSLKGELAWAAAQFNENIHPLSQSEQLKQFIARHSQVVDGAAVPVRS